MILHTGALFCIIFKYWTMLERHPKSICNQKKKVL
jgi:hypothetical protein